MSQEQGSDLRAASSEAAGVAGTGGPPGNGTPLPSLVAPMLAAPSVVEPVVVEPSIVTSASAAPAGGGSGGEGAGAGEAAPDALAPNRSPRPDPRVPYRPKKRHPLHREREFRRRRLRRRGRRAYIRSVYSLPSLATLGNAICGFGAMYVASLDAADKNQDFITNYFIAHNFLAAAYLIFFAMVFDALDGRLARFTRHTTDFGGQLDSLADVVSFGVAPAFVALQLFKSYPHDTLPPVLSRLIWAIAALYMSCAAIRLARFNVSNEHGEQHHYSFLGLPSPGAGGAVAAFILLQRDLQLTADEAARAGAAGWGGRLAQALADGCVWVLPALVLLAGLLMVSTIRYPHLVNRYLRGRRSLGRLILVLVLLLGLIVAHRYVLAVGSLVYALWGATSWGYFRLRRRAPATPG